MIEDVILFHGVNVIIFEGLGVIIFHGVMEVPFILCYHLMFLFLTVCKCYRFCVIIFPCTGWVLSLCYHLML
jgi:hypothetical protein